MQTNPIDKDPIPFLNALKAIEAYDEAQEDLAYALAALPPDSRIGKRLTRMLDAFESSRDADPATVRAAIRHASEEEPDHQTPPA